jgi:hypothetical protein
MAAKIILERGVMQYKVLPFIGRIKSGQTADEVSNQLEALIRQGANEGWTFHDVSSVNIEVQPGCLAGLLGAKASYIRYDMAVFKRED